MRQIGAFPVNIFNSRTLSIERVRRNLHVLILQRQPTGKPRKRLCSWNLMRKLLRRGVRRGPAGAMRPYRSSD